MNDDLVERLRTFDIYDYADADKICREAAARIESQAARIAKLEAALCNIAADCEDDCPPSYGAIKYAARAALEGGEDE